MQLTFSKPLSTEEFWTVIKNYNIKPFEAYIRYYDEKGTRATGYGVIENEEQLQKLIDGVNKLEGNNQYEGIISVSGTGIMSLDEVTSLINEPNVFCVDATPELVKDMLTTKLKDKPIQFKQINNLFWFVEDFKN